MFLIRQLVNNAEIMNTSMFTWKTLSPSKVKNHDLPHIGFSHNPLTGKNGYKVTSTVRK